MITGILIGLILGLGCWLSAELGGWSKFLCRLRELTPRELRRRIDVRNNAMLMTYLVTVKASDDPPEQSCWLVRDSRWVGYTKLPRATRRVVRRSLYQYYRSEALIEGKGGIWK